MVMWAGRASDRSAPKQCLGEGEGVWLLQASYSINTSVPGCKRRKPLKEPDKRKTIKICASSTIKQKWNFAGTKIGDLH